MESAEYTHYFAVRLSGAALKRNSTSGSCRLVDVEAVEGLCVVSMSRYFLSKTTKQRSGKLCKD